MTNTLTPDGAIFLAALAIAALCALLYILITARKNNGIAIVPGGLVSFLTGGFDGITLTPSLAIVASDYRNLPALIVHERVHQAQMRRDGTLTFLWRYITSRTHRLNYEVEAYRAWIEHSPGDRWRVVGMLQGYGKTLTYADAEALLSNHTESVR